jgi:hypothetical protein
MPLLLFNFWKRVDPDWEVYLAVFADILIFALALTVTGLGSEWLCRFRGRTNRGRIFFARDTSPLQRPRRVVVRPPNMVTTISRRYLLLTACGAALVALPFMVYFIVWAPNSPNSLRASLDRIELGMNEADVRQLLANFPDVPDPWPKEGPPITGEVWSSRDGDSKYRKWQQPIAVVLLLRPDRNRPNQIAKATSSGIAYVDLEDHRVVGKTWLEFRRP